MLGLIIKLFKRVKEILLFIYSIIMIYYILCVYGFLRGYIIGPPVNGHKSWSEVCANFFHPKV